MSRSYSNKSKVQVHHSLPRDEIAALYANNGVKLSNRLQRKLDRKQKHEAKLALPKYGDGE